VPPAGFEPATRRLEDVGRPFIRIRSGRLELADLVFRAEQSVADPHELLPQLLPKSAASRAGVEGEGLRGPRVDKIVAMVNNHLDTKPSTLASLELGGQDQPLAQPVVQSLWMLVTDLFATAVPVMPFTLLDLPAARLTSVAVTFKLPVGLGIGRAPGRATGASLARSLRPSRSRLRLPEPSGIGNLVA
jgi:hypothetical protein